MPDLAEIEAACKDCTKCPLAATRTQVVFGRGDPGADLVFVGEAPGAEEDAQGFPFVGRSGKLLDRLVLEEIGLERDGFFVMNTLMCRPPNNRDPLPEELAACRPWFDAKLDALDPKVIVTLGNFASKALLGTTTGITKLRGQTYEWRDGIALVPTFHPAAVLRGNADAMASMRADLVRAKHVLQAR
ncbi:MAG TPA: uracil-DNA glycosylase [Acidimicrobiales bacterium]|nr:uracil-DNA glycosylase [Acidimicrobiales bacterium]